MAIWKRSQHLWIAACVAVLAATSAFAADGDKSSVKGLITAIDGSNVTVRDSSSVDHTFSVTSSTVIKK